MTEVSNYEDGDGLRLVVKTTGRKSWLLLFQLAGRHQKMGLGSRNQSQKRPTRSKRQTPTLDRWY
ncbi:Arm DNA-binding domain-containing protein [Pseudomonas brassicacearum]|uniref:Arm DNA-binding domain-containing protein n=1 Tax=Pseudomonas brassicacearum TaxID=930166 RepID=UPI002FF9F605